MQNSMMMFSFFRYRPEIPFLGIRNNPFWVYLVHKNQNCQFKLKFGTQTSLNMQNSVVKLNFSVFDRKYLFRANLAGFDLTTRDSYSRFKLKFSRTIFQQKTCISRIIGRSQEYGLKTCNIRIFHNVIFLETFLSLISSIIYFSIEETFCEHNFLRTRD